MTFTSPKTLCRRLGLTPRKSLGQHFLVHPEPARRLAAALALTGNDTVVEIGAGLGALTVFLAAGAGRIYALELDPRTAQALQEAVLLNHPQVTVLVQDALHFDFQHVSQQLGQKLIVVGNLPYQITSPLLFKLLEAREAVSRMAFMMQKEVGARLLASPGSKDYGQLTVLLQYHFQMARLFSLSPNNFYPPPKVDSVVITFTPQLPPILARDTVHLARLVKLAFATRRKTLKNTLAAHAPELGATPAQVLQALADLAIDPSRRAETLAVSDFVHLSNALQAEPVPPGS